MRYVAFLGGINVGGHRVTMDRLRSEFVALGHDDVSTFIASGNVLFTAAGRAGAIERVIEARLERELGYAVPAFVRTAGAVVSTVAREPFGPTADGDTHLVGFLGTAPTAAAARATEALSNDRDRFEVHGRDLYWRVHGGVSDSSVKPATLARTIGRPFTTRNLKSLRTLVTKLEAPLP